MWPALIAGGPSEVAGSLAASSSGTTVTAPATANTKTGAVWAQLIASTARHTDWAIVTLTNNSAAARYLVDIGIGAAAAEVVRIPDLHFGQIAANRPGPAYLFPLHVPAGSRLSARCQCSTLSSTLQVSVRLISGTFLGAGGMGLVTAYGVNTADSGLTAVAAAAANVEGGWVQLSAATAYPMRWLVFHPSHDAAAVATIHNALLEVGIGALGAEVVVMPDQVVRLHTLPDVPQPNVFSFPVNIPAGVRLCVRAQADIAASASSIYDCGIWGVS